MSRVDYVKYDDKSIAIQNDFKNDTEKLISDINTKLVSPRAKELALTKIEECYMWIGKAIRDDQIKRNGSAQLQD